MKINAELKKMIFLHTPKKILEKLTVRGGGSTITVSLTVKYAGFLTTKYFNVGVGRMDI